MVVLEALGSLLVAVAAEVGALDDAGRAVVTDLHFQPAVADLEHGHGDRLALVDAAFAAGRRRSDPAALELLHAERNALLLDIDVEHDGFDRLALVMKRQGFLAGRAPGDVRHVDHAVDVAVETDEQAELGRILDLALDLGADRVRSREGLPRIGLGLLEAERDATLLAVDLEHRHVDLLRGRDDLARMDVLLGPAHLGDVDEALDARLELDERAVLGDVGHPALEHAANRILGRGAFPRIGLELLHAEADALGLAVDADDLHLHRVADVEDLGRMADALVADVGDLEQAGAAAEVDEGAVIGDVLDDAVDHLAFGERLDQ